MADDDSEHRQVYPHYAMVRSALTQQIHTMSYNTRISKVH